MVEKIGLRVQNDVEVIEIALEIRHQYFDSRIWVAMSDGPWWLPILWLRHQADRP